MKKISIAIDAMGGDYGVDVVVPACIRAAKNHSNLKLILVGVEDKIAAILKKHGQLSSSQFSIVYTTEVVEMDELPSHALRNKKNSSMRLALNLVKDGEAQACVSAGNTGALMATARYVLKTLPGIDRPAIISKLPTLKGQTWVIDLGANVDSCAEHLFQFAVMGSSLIQAIENKSPRIALLNIGVEEIKGNDQVKRTAHMLSECNLLNYVGYVEGDEFYTGAVDLIVCDGFVGNVALKTSEGLAMFMLNIFEESFKKNWLNKLIGLAALPIFNQVKKRMDPSRHNGASMLGLNGIVVKSHGGANQLGFEVAIRQAMLEVQNNAVDLVRDKINEFINQGLLL